MNGNIDKAKEKLLAVAYLKKNEGHVKILGYDALYCSYDDYEIVSQSRADSIDVDFYLIDKADHGRFIEEGDVYVPTANAQVIAMVDEWKETNASRLDASFPAMFTGFTMQWPEPVWWGQIVCRMAAGYGGKAPYSTMSVARRSIGDHEAIRKIATDCLRKLDAIMKGEHA